MSDIKDILNEIEGEISEKDKTLIDKAFHFAKKAHEGQKRLSGEPYFIHVYETAKILAKQGMDANTIAAGFMHDVLEDAEVSEQEIEKEFGNEILFLIKGVTKLGKLKYRGHERHVQSFIKFFM